MFFILSDRAVFHEHALKKINLTDQVSQTKTNMNINKNLIWIKFLIWIHLACINKKVCKVCIVTFDQSYITLEISLSTFWLSFIFFIFAFWPIETTTPNLKGLAHSDSSKSTTRVILSNEHMTNFFGRKVTWFTTT